MDNDFSPNDLQNLLRADLESTELWQDLMMMQFRKQYWETLNEDLNKIAHEVTRLNPVLNDFGLFLKSLTDFSR
jgi:hypothetical protein